MSFGTKKVKNMLKIIIPYLLIIYITVFCRCNVFIIFSSQKVTKRLQWELQKSYYNVNVFTLIGDLLTLTDYSSNANPGSLRYSFNLVLISSLFMQIPLYVLPLSLMTLMLIILEICLLNR